MKKFQSNKIVTVIAMTRAEYNEYRGWELPSDENGEDAGYLVEYLDGGEPNHPEHKGYISWSPKAQFDDGYREVVYQDKVEKSHIDSMAASLTFQFARIGDTTTTVSEAFLPNGFSVGSGKSACVDPDNFNYEDGCKYAEQNAQGAAYNKLWELEGYLLKVTGHTSDWWANEPKPEAPTMYERLVTEAEDLRTRTGKLEVFLRKGQPEYINDEQWGLLVSQLAVMTNLQNILDKRVHHIGGN